MTEFSYRQLSDCGNSLEFTTPKTQITLARFFRIPEAIAYSGLSRTALYALMGDGKITARKSGRATLIERESLDRHLDALPPAEIGASKAA